MRTIQEIVKIQSELIDGFTFPEGGATIGDAFGEIAATFRGILTREELKMYREHVAYFKAKFKDADRLHKIGTHTKKRHALNVKKIVEEREVIEQHGTRCTITRVWGQEYIPHIYTEGEDHGSI